MTKGQEAANVLAILVNRIEPHFDINLAQITHILSRVSDDEWDSILHALRVKENTKY